MSGLPTLLRPGFIVPADHIPLKEKENLKNTISIDYILNFIKKRIPPKKGSKIPLMPKKYGEKVIILKSDTGSGKSTTLPAKLYTTFFNTTQKNIIVTQPRILTAMDIPSTIVPFVKELELDKNIGYNTGAFKRLPTEKGVIFSTVGVLTQQLILNDDETFMKIYQFIIIDEVHERDIETDLCLFLLKKFIQNNYQNSDCPLIILCSATFNEKIFIEYFDTPPENYIQVKGSTFPIENVFTDYNISNYLKYAKDKACYLHLKNLDDINNNQKFRDIIIFVNDSGNGKKIYDDLLLFNSLILDKDNNIIQKYIDDLDEYIKQYYKIGGDDNNMNTLLKDKTYYILPILLDKKNFESGGLEYQNLFSLLEIINVPLWKIKENKIDINDKPYKYVIPSRRIIIATNIAETGVTIPTLKYCIDTGYHLNVEFNPNIGCNIMTSKNITKGMAIQRRGRVGRKAPGVWYPCYKKETYEKLPEDQMTKIISSDSTENLLSILIKEKNVDVIEEKNVEKISKYKKYKLFQTFSLTDNSWYYINNEMETNLASLDLIEMPSIQTLSHSIEKLHLLGYIDKNYNVTDVGFYANKIRFISLELKRMIMCGYHFGANILDLITISSFSYISKRKIFNKKFQIKNFLKISDTEFEFYKNYIIADEFINCIFIWNLFQSFLSKNLFNIDSEYLENLTKKEQNNKKILYLEKIEKWCEENNLLFSGFLEVIAMRDNIIENMISIGLNPYYNTLSLVKNQYNLNNILKQSLEDGIEEIKKIKQCIFEGFKCNIFILRKKEYYSLIKQIPLNISKSFIKIIENGNYQKLPKYIVVDTYLFTKKNKVSTFEFSSQGFISVLDNFIDLDYKFFLN